VSVLEILGDCPGDICLLSWRYLIGVLEIFCQCPGDILSASWRYLMGVLVISVGVVEI